MSDSRRGGMELVKGGRAELPTEILLELSEARSKRCQALRDLGEPSARLRFLTESAADILEQLSEELARAV